MSQFLGYILPVLVLLALMCLGAWVYIRIRKKAGDKWEQRGVSRSLRRYARTYGGHVLDEIMLVDNGLSGWAHHILIGGFGVLLVYDLCFPGAYSGKPEDKDWGLYIEGRGRWRVTNPTPFSGQCSGRVNTLLKKEGIKVPVYSVVVLANRSHLTESFIKSDDVVTVKHLHRYLAKGKFEQDVGLDVEKVAKTLLAARPAEAQDAHAEQMTKA